MQYDFGFSRDDAMHGIPDYLCNAKRIEREDLRQDGATDAYQPLIATWLIETSLFLGWHRPRGRLGKCVFEDDDFLDEVGLVANVDEELGTLEVNQKTYPNTVASRTRILKERLAAVRKQAVRDSIGLFSNMALVGKVLSLTRVEMALLGFAAIVTSFGAFKSIVSFHTQAVSTRQFCRLLAQLTGHDVNALQACLRDDAPLVAAGIISVESSLCDLDDKLSLLDGFGALLMQPQLDEATLVNHFLARASAPALDEAAFPHLAQDFGLLTSYLRPALAAGERGVNILLYGLPGTGKTEFAKALARTLESELFEISYADQDGNPVKGESRLRAYNFCQRLLVRRRNAILMFDEIEDVFPPAGNMLALFGFGDGRKPGVSGKAWINRTLERNSTPAIWLTNDPEIDPAYLRRFDYSVRFPIPPAPVRETMARHHLGQFDPPPSWLARIASNEQMTPAQYERAAKVARIAYTGDNALALSMAEQTLKRSATLLGQHAIPGRNVIFTGYDLRFVNASMDLQQVLRGFKGKRRGTLCLHGPAGTGKSEFARYLADQIGVPFLVRRASDVLSAWVGQTERNIATMFADAREQDAMLVLDEADSFLADRRDAHRSWEVTQVNELLTQMEAFDGLFVCTTNLMEKLDQASLRRFTFKVRFDYLDADQCWHMFVQELGRLGGDAAEARPCEGAVRALDKLTPGDFAVAARQFDVLGTAVTPAGLLQQLQDECSAKQGSAKPIGFVGN